MSLLLMLKGAVYLGLPDQSAVDCNDRVAAAVAVTGQWLR